MLSWSMLSLSQRKFTVVFAGCSSSTWVEVVEVGVVEVGDPQCRACQTREHVGDEDTRRCCQYRTCENRDHHEPYEPEPTRSTDQSGTSSPNLLYKNTFRPVQPMWLATQLDSQPTWACQGGRATSPPVRASAEVAMVLPSYNAVARTTLPRVV
jgi:hypothetical protein